MDAPFCGYLLRKNDAGRYGSLPDADRVILRDGIARGLRIIPRRGVQDGRR